MKRSKKIGCRAIAARFIKAHQFDRTQQTLRKLSTKFKEETNHGKSGNDSHPAEGL